jgi:tyrosine phenol-lyase
VEYLGNRLLASYEIPIVKPIGSFGVFLNAKAFLPHREQDELPRPDARRQPSTSTLASAPWSGASCRQAATKRTGDHYYPKLELVRFTIPRRVYTQAHMDVIAESAAAVFDRRKKIKGLKMVYEPKYLRFFQARFERL